MIKAIEFNVVISATRVSDQEQVLLANSRALEYPIESSVLSSASALIFTFCH